jgi:hypothetical protein
MNVYFNSKEDFKVNEQTMLSKGTVLFLEYDNAKDHRLGEDSMITWRLIVDDTYFFNPFRPHDLAEVAHGYADAFEFAGKSYTRNEFIAQKLLNRDSNKSAIVFKHTRELLKVEGYTAAYYIEGAMSAILLLNSQMATVADKVGHHARIEFRNKKGYDPITGNQVVKVSNSPKEELS